jgi:hypothetical protein
VGDACGTLAIFTKGSFVKSYGRRKRYSEEVDGPPKKERSVGGAPFE